MFRSLTPRRVALAATAMLTAGILTACSTTPGTGSAAAGAAPGDVKHTIAVSFPNASAAPVVQNLFRIAKNEAKAKGYNLVIDDPGSDEAKQVNTIQTWIQQGVGAIVASTLDPKVLDGVAKQARAAGIKWVTFGDSIPDQDATLGFPHSEAGQKLGQAAGDWITKQLGGHAKVAILSWAPAEYARQRQDGITSALKAAAPGVEIVATQDALSSTDGLAKVSTILQAHPDLNMVLAVEDAAGQGGYQAFLNAGHAGNDPKVFVGGIDGAQDELKLVQQGTMYRATSAFNQQLLGEGFVTLPDALLHGETKSYYTPVELVENGNPDITKLLGYYGG
ncbi:sugar ABC transporter substrate-binding protein [Sinomonas sp. ASV322]|uniref:sugar ABC transporter substrate-binding protein n=1 Tax=Sinomonas sp. ASV322 TaxID=3041920 RepID=UPI0027DCEA76|nr:sugar ABC transporter substrate-binding protein [Sinomonas sp. ASV322]MDQ4501793.1 sugar ABC transporter substrate-binding protein [Sinomonas sp. ASV322]